VYYKGCSTKKIKIETRCFDEIALKNQLVQITCWKDILSVNGKYKVSRNFQQKLSTLISKEVVNMIQLINSKS
jgi:hypothetical protein